MELSIFPLTLATQFIISHTIINIYLIHSLFYVFRIEIERSSSITLHSANEGSFVELKDPKYPAEKPWGHEDRRTTSWKCPQRRGRSRDRQHSNQDVLLRVSFSSGFSLGEMAWLLGSWLNRGIDLIGRHGGGAGQRASRSSCLYFQGRMCHIRTRTCGYIYIYTYTMTFLNTWDKYTFFFS